MNNESDCLLVSQWNLFRRGLTFAFDRVDIQQPIVLRRVLSSIIGGSCYKYHFGRGKKKNVRRDKHVFVTTKHVFCRGKSMLVATKLLSLQNYVCRDNTFVVTNICRDKHVFGTSIFLSRYLWQLPPMIEQMHTWLLK